MGQRISVLLGLAALAAAVAWFAFMRDAEREERSYLAMISAGASHQQLCEQGRKVADAWVARGDRDRVAKWQAEASTNCYQATLPGA